MSSWVYRTVMITWICSADNGVRSGFVPPFVKKALDGPEGNGREKENAAAVPKALEFLIGMSGT
jgi:hypothetical protein